MSEPAGVNFPIAKALLVLSEDDAPDGGSATEAGARIEKAIGAGGWTTPTRVDSPQASNLRALEEMEGRFDGTGAIDPPYPPRLLAYYYRHSSDLRSCIDARRNNIHGGHLLETRIKVDDDAELAEAIYLEWCRLKEDPRTKDDRDVKAFPDWPEQEHIDSTRKTIEREIRMERARAAQFFRQCSRGISFKTLCKETETDLGTFGYAYWEIRRLDEGRGRISRITRPRAWTVRILPIDKDPVEVRSRRLVGVLGWETVVDWERFPRYVQDIPGIGVPRVYFKEFGDPRVLSAQDGQVYNSCSCGEVGVKVEPSECQHPTIHAPTARPLPEGHAPATELYHWNHEDPVSVYGMPIWFGALLAVAISRDATERDYNHLQNNGIPDLFCIFEGADAPDGLERKLRRMMESNTRGVRNAGRVIVLSLPPNPVQGGQQPKFRTEPAAKAAMTVGDLMKVKQENSRIVRRQFRLPDILVGESRDQNRSTSDSALMMAESQVFQPDREEFDDVINIILEDLGIRYLRFRTVGPTVKDPEMRMNMAKAAASVGGMTPEEVHEIACEIFAKEWPALDEAWSKQPTDITRAQISAGARVQATPEAPPEDGSPDAPEGKDVAQGIGQSAKTDGEVRKFIAFRAKVLKALADEQAARFAKAGDLQDRVLDPEDINGLIGGPDSPIMADPGPHLES